MRYAFETETVLGHFPFAGFVGGRAMCSDGKVRTLARISVCADSFNSVPAAVKVNGKTVSGYITIETAEGWQCATESDPNVVKFVATGKNAHLLPNGTWKHEKEKIA